MHYWSCLSYAKQGISLISHRCRVACNFSLRFCRVHAAPGGKSRKFLLDHFSLLSFFLPFLFPFMRYCPRKNCWYLSCSVTGKEKEGVWEEEKAIMSPPVIVERLKIELGNLLPINCIFIRYSYHPNWIYMQSDAACVGTGGIIAKHGQVSYANGAHFPTNLKWLSLYPYSYNALIT